MSDSGHFSVSLRWLSIEKVFASGHSSALSAALSAGKIWNIKKGKEPESLSLTLILTLKLYAYEKYIGESNAIAC